MVVESLIQNESGLIKNYPHDDSWNLKKFKKNFSISIINFVPGSETIEIDFKFMDPTFANAIRRAITAEVPSIAFDRIYFHQNSGIIADEVLALRIGLLPLNIPPDYLEFPKEFPDKDDIEDFNETQHIIFDLEAKHFKGKGADNQFAKSVYSEEFNFVPFGSQSTNFPRACKIENPKILLTKLGLGDEIKARCIAVKGIGRDHAKFEPVSTCFYKFHSNIKLNETFDGELAIKLKESFPKGVIEIDSKTGQAVVKNSRLENGSREFLRHDEFKNGQVQVTMDPNHCIFYIETLVPEARSPDKLLKEGIEIMIEKTNFYINIIKDMEFLTNLSEGLQNEDQFLSSFPVKAESEFLCGRQVQFEVVSISKDLHNGTFRFNGEDHTLGGALRYCILKLPSEPFCGYCVPHPLEDSILVNIQNNTGIPVHNSLLEGLELLRDSFEHILACYEKSLQKIMK